jgi:hypothetical protein
LVTSDLMELLLDYLRVLKASEQQVTATETLGPELYRSQGKLALVETLLNLRATVTNKAKQKPQTEYIDNENSFRNNGNLNI